MNFEELAKNLSGTTVACRAPAGGILDLQLTVLFSTEVTFAWKGELM